MAVVVAMSAGLGGCVAWNYIKQGYDNFSAYFNTFYNASMLYDQALKDIQQSKQTYELTLLAGNNPAPFAISQTAKQNFNEVIVKASKVLQYHPNSEFTEDCLFMIGIAYYYQADNLRGERKFLEIESTFPKTKRFAEAEMYYGGLQLTGMEKEEGRDRVLHAIVLAKQEKLREVVAMSSAILSDYYLKQGDTLKAADYLDTASAFSDGDAAAIYACRAGNLHTSMREYPEALDEYTRTRDQARDINIRFYGTYYLARVHRLMHDYHEALTGLKRIRTDDKYFTYFPLVDYQEATVLFDSGEVSTAVTDYQKIDTAYSTSEAATRSAYRLASTYLYLVGDFQTALKYYQRVGSHPQVYPISDDGRQMATLVQGYLISSYKVVLSDSLYRQAVIARERNDTTSTYTAGALDTLYEHAAQARDELAGMLMFKLQMPDSAVKSYKIILKHFSKSKVYPSALYTLGEYYYTSGDTAEGRKYLQELIADHQDSPFAISASSVLGTSPPVYVDSSQIRYSQAVTLTDSGNYPAALDTLKGLINDKKSALAPQALYTAGWIYEHKLQMPDSAFKFYKQLSVEFPSSRYSERVTLAVRGYESAQQDSAMERKRRADSIAAAAAREEKPDSTRNVPGEIGKPGQRMEQGTEQKHDSLGTPIKAPEDSLKIRKPPSKEIFKPRI